MLWHILQGSRQLPHKQTAKSRRVLLLLGVMGRPGLHPRVLPLTFTTAEYVHLTEGVSKQGKKDLLRTAWPCVYM